MSTLHTLSIYYICGAEGHCPLQSLTEYRSSSETLTFSIHSHKSGPPSFYCVKDRYSAACIPLMRSLFHGEEILLLLAEYKMHGNLGTKRKLGKWQMRQHWGQSNETSKYQGPAITTPTRKLNEHQIKSKLCAHAVLNKLQSLSH